ncbi:MAG: hypothetical protein OXG15_04545 [Gammaproteobacteria bacterium]|nr:hypothetical protein [Gammaproteobacteria bacterium]
MRSPVATCGNFFKVKTLTIRPASRYERLPSRMNTLSMRRLTFFVALILCVGQTFADSHLHVDEHEEGECTVCAIVETGFVLEIVRPNNPSSRWRSVNNASTYSVTFSERPYALHWSRAPPIS